MKNAYSNTGGRNWLLIVWAMSLFISITAKAQSVKPPVIQWQRVTEATLETSLPFQVIKASSNGYAVIRAAKVLRLADDGSILWDKRIPATNELPIANGAFSIVALPDGGFGVLVRGTYQWALARLNADGDVIWAKPFVGRTSESDLTRRSLQGLLRTADGGYLAYGATMYGRDGTIADLYKFDADGNLSLTKQVPLAPPRPNSFPYQIIQTSDGGYLVAGSGHNGGEITLQGWVAKLDAQLNIVQQKLYSYLKSITDVIPTPYGNEGFIVSGIHANDQGTSTLYVNPNGGGDNTSGTYRPSAANTLSLIASSTSTSHEVADDIDQNGRDIRLISYTNFNETRWTKTLGGSGSEVVKDFIPTDDGGFIVIGTTTSTDGDVQGKSTNDLSTWIVKLSKPGLTNSLTLAQPTYNCQTGEIRFNTSGGDGSTITYTAPGISRVNVTDNFGTVEQGLRNDPKVIPITATQSGYTTSYAFDFGSYCNNQPSLIGPPTLISPIPDETRMVGRQIVYDIIDISSHFRAPGATKSFRPVVNFKAEGLPEGMLLFDSSIEFRPLAYIGGTPTTTGVYTVTVSAFVSNLVDKPTTTTTFKITITDSNTNPPTSGGALTLAQPTYNCQTGAITFNTSGGNGSTITYTAPGISRANVTDNFGTVEQGLRNDPKMIPITATQSGVSVTYNFDLAAACNSTPGGGGGGAGLTLLAPTYNCQTGAITFKTSGGNGSTITYTAPGISRANVTDNFGTVEQGLRNDPKVIPITATQNGVSVTYNFDLKAACSSGNSSMARLASREPSQELRLVVLGNPTGDQLRVRLEGTQGQAVDLQLVDASGKLLESRGLKAEQVSQEQMFDVSRQRSGLLLLRAKTSTQASTVKVLKQ